jgi:thiamine biosynthesis lipoprotein
MLMSRARPLLGTVVSIHVHAGCAPSAAIESAIDKAFHAIAHISKVMSAHDPESDLGRMASGHAGNELTVDPQTLYVIKAAQYWCKRSGGAFDPGRAGEVLSRKGRRPALVGNAMGGLQDIFVESDTSLRLVRPVKLDLGGIAKGFAVDRAIEALVKCGIDDALVNAGGDMRAVGLRQWPVDVRHADQNIMDMRLRSCQSLRGQAIATSVSGRWNPEFVSRRSLSEAKWQSVTVVANSCLLADVLTKWAMQASLLCPQLRQVLRLHSARMWRT